MSDVGYPAKGAVEFAVRPKAQSEDKVSSLDVDWGRDHNLLFGLTPVPAVNQHHGPQKTRLGNLPASEPEAIGALRLYRA